MSDEVEYEMAVNHPALPKGAEIQIPGLGVFKNGHSYKISKDEAQGFRVHHTRQVDVTDDSGAVVGSEPELGPTLLQASKSMYGVEVNTPGSSKPESGSGTPGNAGNAGNRHNPPTTPQQPVKAPEVQGPEQSGGEK